MYVVALIVSGRETKGIRWARTRIGFADKARSRQIYSPDGIVGLLRRLEHLHDGFNSLHTETALRITDVQLRGT